MNLMIQQVLLCAVLAMGGGGYKGAPIVGRVQSGSGGLASCVVYLEGVHGDFAAPSRLVTLNQQGKQFAPHVIAAMKGQTVEFLNSDDFLHNTYSASKTQQFNLNQPVRGSRSLLKLTKAGVIEVRCHIHGSMLGWIVVTDNPFFAVTDSRGIFRIDNVPPGTYKIKSWSEQYGTITEEVTVSGSGAKTILKYAR